MERAADVAVVGLGAMGTAALWRLASRGADVLGFEQFEPGHAMGSSHGATRIFRVAYFEDPRYVPLLLAAGDLWRLLESESAHELVNQTGGLMIGPPEGELIRGTLLSARTHRLPHSVLEHSEMAARYPQHKLDPGDVGVLDELASVLFPERSIVAAASVARDRGAVIHTGACVERIEPDSAHVDIVVGSQTFRARHAIVCAGSWLPRLLPVPGCELAIERQVMTWFRALAPDQFAPGLFPPFVRELAGGGISFGIPDMGDGFVKVGLHHGDGELVDPDSIDRSTHARDRDAKESLVARTIDGLVPEVVKATVCMYTNSPDGAFVIGEMPGAPTVTVVSPCSGHGFKFAPVIGEIAADLALRGGTDYDIDLFSPDRFSRSQRAVSTAAHRHPSEEERGT